MLEPEVTREKSFVRVRFLDPFGVGVETALLFSQLLPLGADLRDLRLLGLVDIKFAFEFLDSSVEAGGGFGGWLRCSRGSGRRRDLLVDGVSARLKDRGRRTPAWGQFGDIGRREAELSQALLRRGPKTVHVGNFRRYPSLKVNDLLPLVSERRDRLGYLCAPLSQLREVLKPRARALAVDLWERLCERAEQSRQLRSANALLLDRRAALVEVRDLLTRRANLRF